MPQLRHSQQTCLGVEYRRYFLLCIEKNVEHIVLNTQSFHALLFSASDHRAAAARQWWYRQRDRARIAVGAAVSQCARVLRRDAVKKQKQKQKRHGDAEIAFSSATKKKKARTQGRFSPHLPNQFFVQKPFYYLFTLPHPRVYL